MKRQDDRRQTFEEANRAKERARIRKNWNNLQDKGVRPFEPNEKDYDPRPPRPRGFRG